LLRGRATASVNRNARKGKLTGVKLFIRKNVRCVAYVTYGQQKVSFHSYRNPSCTGLAQCTDGGPCAPLEVRHQRGSCPGSPANMAGLPPFKVDDYWREADCPDVPLPNVNVQVSTPWAKKWPTNIIVWQRAKPNRRAYAHAPNQTMTQKAKKRGRVANPRLPVTATTKPKMAPPSGAPAERISRRSREHRPTIDV
jgi:hypothetical protein